ncbi:M48 family metallopeptidase [Leeia sp. TBRC 13508]|uniref:M48 family metallopeptidase n=1 Tax=Leeia speluncae TaxID=2884804 RepID=A0ABS8D752_9NEIS|nr:M48 family metallopeptidase [Leeia speluncae]MCB6184025.1 M48 family metallopeptidase [Leeia speluncae]
MKTYFPRLSLVAALLLGASILSACGPNSKGMQQFAQLIPDKNTRDAVTGVAQMTSDVSPEEELAMGKEMSAYLLGAKPLLKNAAVENYVNKVGRWIALQSDRPDLNWHFGVIDTPSVNAFAAPSGYVFVTKGLLKNVKNESELAGVLGHEIAHVIKRHHVNAIKKQGGVKLFGAVLNKQAQKEGSAESQLFANAMKNMFTSGLSHSDEFEADKMGVVLATRAGYNPYGLPSVLQMYASDQKDPGFELLTSTHPLPNDRIDRLDKLMGTKLDGFEQTGSNDSSRLKAIQRLLR